MPRAFAKAIIFTALSLIFANQPQVLAQSEQTSGVSIVPAITEIVAEPGTSTDLEIKITNISNQALAIATYTQPIVPIDPEINGSLRARYDASTWLMPVKPSLLLAKSETQDVKVTISPPADAGPGGHYALVTFRILNNQTTEESSTVITPEVSSLIFITVPGDIIEQADVNFKADDNWQLSKPRKFIMEFANTGNIHLLPNAQIDIKDSHDQVVESITLEQRLVLPNTKATFEASWLPRTEGRYHAQLNLSYGTPTQNMSFDSNKFWVLPGLWTLIFWLVILIIFILVLIRLAKKYIIKRYFSRKQYHHDHHKLSGNVITADFDDLLKDKSINDRSRKK